jgi:hypothetical protein
MLVILIILSLILIGGAFCAVFKPGKNDGISNYGYKED